MRGKITKRAVDAVKPHASSDVFLWDSALRGFGVRVKPSGARSFLVSYYAPGLHRVRRRVTLGALGPLTVDDARAAATLLLARVSKGEDPASAQVEDRRKTKEETVERLFADYLDYARAHFKLRTVEFYESLGRLYVVPHFGALPVAKLTTRDVARLHDTALRDKPATANRVVALIKAFYHWLERRELFTGKNPARGIEMYRENGRERFLTVEEMARLGQALRVAETIGLPPAPGHAKEPRTARPRNAGMFSSELQPANPVAVAALRFLLFTGWREQEALTLRWEFVNLRSGMVTLPDSKTGKSQRALAAPAVELLAAQPRVKGSAYVFPGREPSKPLREIQRLWYAARHEAKLPDVRLHDLRHSVASFAGGAGYSLFLIQKLLGHKTARSTERYAHLADDARKIMADDVGETIRAALESDPKTAHLAAASARLALVRK